MGISLICSTVRLGGLDCFFSSIMNQRDFPFSELQVILVDEWYEERKVIVAGRVGEYSSSSSRFNFLHIPSKGGYSCFDDGTGWNTGAAAADGELVIFQVDYSYLYSRMLADHWAAYKQHPGYSLTGYCERYGYPRLRSNVDKLPVDEVAWSTFLRPFRIDRIANGLEYFDEVQPLYLEDKGGVKGAEVAPGLWELSGDKFYAALNESIPLRVLKDLNGWDERYNGGYSANDIDLGTRANIIGWKFLVDPKSVNMRFGMPGMSVGVIPQKSKPRLRKPEENFKIFQARLKAIVEGREDPVTPDGFGAWR